MFNVKVVGHDKLFKCAHANGITIICFGLGSAAAATCIDLLIAIQPTAVLFLGKCGGLKNKTEVGSYVLPIGAIRGESTSDEYLPKACPS